MKRVNIIFDDREAGLLSALQKEYGGSLPQVIRDAVKFRFDKTFPPRLRSTGSKVQATLLEAEPELTPEQACESVGGKVESVNGVPMCVIQISKSMAAKVPLSDQKAILKYKKP